MQHRKAQLILLLIGLFFTVQCGHPDFIEEPDKIVKVREFTTLSKDQSLTTFKNNIEISSLEGRVKSTLVDRVNWNKVYKVYNASKQTTTYTIPMIVSTPNQFDNLVVVEKDGEQHSYILRYIPEKEWIKTKPRRGGFGNFTGVVEIVSMEGEVQESNSYKNGKVIINGTDNSNGRVADCVTYYQLEWTEVCVDGYGCWVSEVNYSQHTVCTGGGGGGGYTGGGDPSGGGTDPGIGGGGGGGVTPIGGGDPGVGDPIDVSYFLIPVNRGDNLSQPYHGMTATDNNGVVYTYDATINAWLLPDLQILVDNGYNFNFNNQFVNDFDGQILSTVTAIALVEPTPIGEIIVGGVLLVIFIYQVYEITTEGHNDYEICQILYEQCQGRNRGYGQCYDCRDECNSSQGAWPFYKCHWGN